MRCDDWASAAALYDGGWRAEDRDELVAEYDLSEEEADAICEDLRRMDEKEDRSMKKDELRRHLGTVTLGLDTQWGLMHRQDLDDSTRVAAAGQYQGMLFTITALGGDWLRDDNNKHRVFLMGESSRDTDEYNSKED